MSLRARVGAARCTRRAAVVGILALLVAICAAAPAYAKDVVRASDAVAARACAALEARVDSFPAAKSILLRSFGNPAGAEASEDPALATAAFAYDNALAVIALVACDRAGRAGKIGNALLAASNESRLRNAYLAGPQPDTPAPNGWWSEKEGRWLQDPYQTGIATGNAAWVALAFLTLAERTGEKRWITAAERVAAQIVADSTDESGPGGFVGGVSGLDGHATRLTWKSSEHNIDLVAVFSRLGRATGSARWKGQAGRARRFVDAQFDSSAGRFLIGTLPDGRTSNRAVSGLDTQLWPLLLPDADPRWRSALAFAEHAHRVPGGFDYNDDRDGLWVEGTAQAALVYRALERGKAYEACMAELSRHFSAGGFLFATREPRITTGLAINPDSRAADLYYFHVPHLGATAWAALAGSGWNPFLGKRI